MAHAGQLNVYTEDHLASRHCARIDKLYWGQIIFLSAISTSLLYLVLCRTRGQVIVSTAALEQRAVKVLAETDASRKH